jgi:hypothetical protein
MQRITFTCLEMSRPYRTEPWARSNKTFFSKALETGIILSIANMKKEAPDQTAADTPLHQAVVYFQNITETREARILST